MNLASSRARPLRCTRRIVIISSDVFFIFLFIFFLVPIRRARARSLKRYYTTRLNFRQRTAALYIVVKRAFSVAIRYRQTFYTCGASGCYAQQYNINDRFAYKRATSLPTIMIAVKTCHARYECNN